MELQIILDGKTLSAVTYSHINLSTDMMWASLQPDEGYAKFPLWYFYP
jgi:hypothetical protein